MENSELAVIFHEMAELLELKEDNPFRIRAYENAALNIENLSESLEKTYNTGGLKALEDVPGIGKGIAQHIEELIKTGKLKELDALKKKIPDGVLQVMAIPGVGPKTAMLSFKKLKIDSVDKMEKAARSGVLMKLPGFKEKKINNILQGIELKKRHIGRFSIGVALPFAELLVEELRKLKEVDRIMPCGSLRRAKETIGDIDILITSRKPAVVMTTFVKLPYVDRVLGRGETKTSVILKNGMQADLRVVAPESFGAAVYYFTGNREHNIKIRELGIKKGLKINEYGVFKGKKLLAGAEENDVFKALGLPYIQPEMREDRGEIEAAKKGALPDLIKIEDVRGDLHSHTKATDGANTIREMAFAAKKLGYEYLAITDHSVSTRVAGGLSKHQLISHIKEVEKAASGISGIKLLKGSEVDILPDGSLDYPDEILKELDIVFASVHSIFKMGKKEMTARIIKALRNRYVRVLSHPTGRLIGQRDAYEVDLDEVLKAAADTGTFVELNAQPMRLDLDDVHCRKAKELGITVVITTDAHSSSQLENMRYGVFTARRGWLEKKDVLNTLPYQRLIKRLAV